MTSASDLASLTLPFEYDRSRALSAGGIVLRIAELVVLFLGVPALVWLRVIPMWMFWGILVAGAAYAAIMLSADRTFRWRTAWRWPSMAQVRRVALLWVIGLVVMVGFTVGVDLHLIPLDTRQPHALLLSFPGRNPAVWAAIMVLYPIASAAPQELMFRVFFFHRYERMLGGRWPTILASALLFGWAHILFENWIAVALSVVLGLVIAITYARTRSGSLVWLEHALYGDAAFTIGLGWFFFTGNVAQ